AVAIRSDRRAEAGHAVGGDLESVGLKHLPAGRHTRAINLVKLGIGRALAVVLPNYQIFLAVKGDPRRGLSTRVGADGDSGRIEHFAGGAHPRAVDIVFGRTIVPFVRPHDEVIVVV